MCATFRKGSTKSTPGSTREPRTIPPVHRRAIIVDGHCDTPYRLFRHKLHLDDRDDSAQLDLRKLEESGITASFFAAYVPPFYAGNGAAKFARRLIDIIREEAERYPEIIRFVVDSTGIRKAKADSKIGLMIGIEGGHAIEDSLDLLDEFYALGTRYMTLTHVNTNNWCDSSGDDSRHGGLSKFGREVVARMNRLGMIVDVSHISDQAFYHVLETSSVPPIASHSSCRALTSHPRNLTDAMLRDLASAGGVCMINFFSAFVNEDVARMVLERSKTKRQKPKSSDEELLDDKADWDAYTKSFAAMGTPPARLEDAVDHIVHAASVAGADSVGIGSDFDGVPALPEGLTDASFLPSLTERLLARGFHEAEVEKVLGGNFLRVYEKIEAGKKT